MRSFWAANDNMWSEKDSSRATDLAFFEFFQKAHADFKDKHRAKSNAHGLASRILTSIRTVWEDVRKK